MFNHIHIVINVILLNYHDINYMWLTINYKYIVNQVQNDREKWCENIIDIKLNLYLPLFKSYLCKVLVPNIKLHVFLWLN